MSGGLSEQIGTLLGPERTRFLCLSADRIISALEPPASGSAGEQHRRDDDRSFFENCTVDASIFVAS